MPGATNTIAALLEESHLATTDGGHASRPTDAMIRIAAATNGSNMFLLS